MQFTVNQQSIYAATADRAIDPERPSVLFVHGAAMDHTVWVLPKRYFVRKGYNVLAVDLPGHGRSQGDAFDTIEANADWLADVLDAAGIERTAVVGHSMGSLIALDFAARHGERVRSAVLIGSAVPMAVADKLMNAAAGHKHAAFEMVNTWGHSKRAQVGGNPNPGIWMTGSGIRLLEASRPGTLHADLQACHHYTAGVERAANIACPVLLILGSEDVMTPPFVAHDIAAAAPNSRTLLLRGSGHALMTERPDEVLDALIESV
ncbi:MAG: alpha/beta hydrolase [Gammaproteobacteria bacterium]|nr:alpha/beta hydrolase [Gammaproteobacteria bacterium]